MNYSKFKGDADVRRLLEHSDRGIDSPDTHNHSNKNIDSSRTALNYDLKNRHGQTAYLYYKNKIEKIAEYTKARTGKSIRKDAVTLCSWIVTAPKDLPDEKLRPFFENIYAWFSERYGEDNVVTASVHMDEVQPHIHFQFVPIIEKDGIRKLCAKDMETPTTLKNAHLQLQQYLEQKLDCDVNLLNGATENGNKTVSELKTETLAKQIAEMKHIREEANKTAENALKQLEKVKADTEAYQNRKNGLNDEIKALESKKKVLTTKEVQEIDKKAKKRFNGGLKNVSYAEYESVKLTALAVDKEKKARKIAEQERDAALERAKKAENDRPSLKMQMELSRLKDNVKYLLGIIQERLPDIFEQVKQHIQGQNRQSSERRIVEKRDSFER